MLTYIPIDPQFKYEAKHCLLYDVKKYDWMFFFHSILFSQSTCINQQTTTPTKVGQVHVNPCHVSQSRKLLHLWFLENSCIPFSESEYLSIESS